MLLLCGNNDNSTVKSLYFFPLELACAILLTGEKHPLRYVCLHCPCVMCAHVWV